MPSRTLGLIKPDSFERRLVGDIISAIEFRGQLRITACKTEYLTQDRAKEFYAEHKDRSNFEKMTQFMASGPCLAMRLESDKDNAWELWRKMLRDLRSKYRSGAGDKNSAHGSDSAEAAER